MKHLHLLRHAKSSWANPDLADQDRPLNKRGLRQLSIMSPILLEEGALNAHIYSSTAERAQQTINGILGTANSTQPHSCDKSLYTFNRKKLLKWLYKLPDDENEVLVIGHNPAIEELLAFLLKTPINSFPTCGYIHLEIDTPSWSALSPLQATIRRFATPSSASYKEFMRKTEKNEFRAKYESQYETSTIRGELLKIFFITQGLLPGCLAAIDPEFIHQYELSLKKAKLLSVALLAHIKDKELEEKLACLTKHSDIVNELKDLDTFIRKVEGLGIDFSEKHIRTLELLKQDFENLRSEKYIQFTRLVESSDFHVERKALKKYLNSPSFVLLCGAVDNTIYQKEQESLRLKIEAWWSKLRPNNDDDDFHRIRTAIYENNFMSEHLDLLTKPENHAQHTKLELLTVLKDVSAQCELLKRYLSSDKNSENKGAHEAAKDLLEQLFNEKEKLKQRICMQ